MEGMRGFARRHFGSLRHETTEFVCLDSVGSPELILIEGEGMLRMRDYTPELRERIAATAGRAGVHLRRGLRLGLATDGLIALKAGYRSAGLGSVNALQVPVQLPQPARHAREPAPRDRARRGGPVRGADQGGRRLTSSRARRSASSRVVMSPAKRSSSRRASSSPTCGPGRHAQLAGQLVAAHERRPRAGGPLLEGVGEHAARASSRWAAIAALGVLAARGEAVGDREHRDVGGVGRGGAQVAPGGAARERLARGRGSRAAGGAA